jgi:hypothetical protein
MTRGKKPAPWFVDFPRKFRSREEFFALINKIAKIHGTEFKIKHPSGEEILAGNTDVVLVGQHMRITAKSGCGNVRISQSHVVRSGISSLADKDWLIASDEFPGLEVKLYQARGRPPKPVVRARAVAKWEEGKSYAEISKELNISSEAVRAYRDPGRTRRPSKTSGN